ncbi:MAG: BMP family ABC transporter substrate-binding protein [Candidatus Riflebacteria bacterium]|nr:BMP family ABC transporter substrate-binding protein [Candidatus Riflebacteria bacterium]
MKMFKTGELAVIETQKIVPVNMRFRNLAKIAILLSCIHFLFSGNSSFAQQNPQKIGVILSIGGLGDHAFNDAAYEGVKNLRVSGNFKIDVFEPSDLPAIERLMDFFGTCDYDLIVGIGVFASDPIKKIAKKFPKKNFLLLDAAVEAPNILSILFNEEEGSFYAGALASLLSKSGKIGFLGGFHSPAIEVFERGFRNGAKFLNPSVDVTVQYAGNTPEAFNAPETGEKLGREMASAGVEVIYHAAGRTGLGLIEAAKKTDIQVIGVDADQSSLAPGKVAASMMKKLDKALETGAKLLKEGKFKGGVLTLGLADGGIKLELSQFHKQVFTPLILERLKQVEDFLTRKASLPVDPKK